MVYLDLLVDNSFTILSFEVVFVSLLYLLTDKAKKIISLSYWAFIVTCFAITVAIYPNAFFVFAFPPTAIPFICIFVTFILFKSKNKNSYTTYTTYTKIQYVVLAMFLLLAFEMSKDPGNTWGSGATYFGVFLGIFIIPLRRLTKLLHMNTLTYALTDIMTGLISMFLIMSNGYTDYLLRPDDNRTMIRNGLELVSLFILFEGIILLTFIKRKPD